MFAALEVGKIRLAKDLSVSPKTCPLGQKEKVFTMTEAEIEIVRRFMNTSVLFYPSPIGGIAQMYSMLKESEEILQKITKLNECFFLTAGSKEELK